MNKPESIPFSRILDWLEGKLPEDEARAIAEQLPMADEATQADLAWLREFQAIKGAVKMASPSAEVREVLRRHFADYARPRPPPGLFRRLIADLIFDSRTQPVLAGLRSAAAEGLQRQLIYTTEVAEVALNIQPIAEGQRLAVTGQVFPTTDAAPEAFSIQLLRQALQAGLTTADELGEFAFDGVPADEYEIILSTAQFEVVIPSVPLRV